MMPWSGEVAGNADSITAANAEEAVAQVRKGKHQQDNVIAGCRGARGYRGRSRHPDPVTFPYPTCPPFGRVDAYSSAYIGYGCWSKERSGKLLPNQPGRSLEKRAVRGAKPRA